MSEPSFIHGDPIALDEFGFDEEEESEEDARWRLADEFAD
jgi:hypothetical protein